MHAELKVLVVVAAFAGRVKGMSNAQDSTEPKAQYAVLDTCTGAQLWHHAVGADERPYRNWQWHPSSTTFFFLKAAVPDADLNVSVPEELAAVTLSNGSTQERSLAGEVEAVLDISSAFHLSADGMFLSCCSPGRSYCDDSLGGILQWPSAEWYLDADDVLIPRMESVCTPAFWWDWAGFEEYVRCAYMKVSQGELHHCKLCVVHIPKIASGDEGRVAWPAVMAESSDALNFFLGREAGEPADLRNTLVKIAWSPAGTFVAMSAHNTTTLRWPWTFPRHFLVLLDASRANLPIVANLKVKERVTVRDLSWSPDGTTLCALVRTYKVERRNCRVGTSGMDVYIPAGLRVLVFRFAGNRWTRRGAVTY